MTMVLKFWKSPTSGHWLARSLEGLFVVNKDIADSEESAGEYCASNKGSILKGPKGKSFLYGFESGKDVEFSNDTVFEMQEESIPSIKLKIV